MRKTTRYIALLTAVTTVLSVATGCFGPETNKEYTDLRQYMLLEYTDEEGNEIIATATEGEVAGVVMEDEYCEDYAILKNGDVYMDIHGIKKFIDDRFYWDSNEGLVMFTNATEIYTTEIGGSTISSAVDETVEYTISFEDNEKCFVNMKFIDKFIDIDYSISEATDSVPAVLVISYENKDIKTYSVKKKTQIRTADDYMAEIVCDVQKKSNVTLLEDAGEWKKVMTESGLIGYILDKHVEEAGTSTVEYTNDDDTYTHNLLDEKVSLVWHQMTYAEGNAYLGDMTASMKGVNVISPTWFTVSDAKGNIDSLASETYVDEAHAMGLKVWALVDDFSMNSEGEYYIKKVLTKTSTRQKLVNNIMKYVRNYNLDGINIDFEYINVAEGSSYLQFLRELSIRCKDAGVTLSIDNYVPSAWTEFYDRKQQLKVADYIIVMNYDEHTAGSDEAGSVSSMPYARQSIQDTIAEVGDSTRVINGMPFYTRVWCETPEANYNGEGKLIEDNVNGNYYLSTQAVSMSTAIDAYTDAGATPAWNEETGQNYVYYELNGSGYRIWLEDETSVRARLQLVDEFNLGGAAYWKLGMETDDIWDVVSEHFDK